MIDLEKRNLNFMMRFSHDLGLHKEDGITWNQYVETWADISTRELEILNESVPDLLEAVQWTLNILKRSEAWYNGDRVTLQAVGRLQAAITKEKGVTDEKN